MNVGLDNASSNCSSSDGGCEHTHNSHGTHTGKFNPYKKRKFGICPEKYGKCPETFRASGKHSETVMFWNIFRTLDSGQILDKFWSVKKMSGICASGKCSKT
ncbi:hypothetical protein RIR_jg11276.t1 [Rhizophagus irregularis DAOM 181602=DAOM 197198]|nr:hypothetical protein RIR_jg11276.t1 [Rhizophagus irregularis DAOM 181602=DAOM 197198]